MSNRDATKCGTQFAEWFSHRQQIAKGIEVLKLFKKPASTLLLMIAVGLVLSACKPSDPQLQFSGIDAPGAIQMLDNSHNPADRQEVYRKLEGDRRVGFDWPYFWSAMGSPARLPKLPPEEQDRVLRLSSESCSVQGFRQLAAILLKIETGFDFVFGAKRVCAQSLGPEVYRSYVRYFGQKPSTLSLAQLVVSEYSLDSRADKEDLLSIMTSAKWFAMMQQLLQTGQGHLAAQLAQMQQREYGGLSFLSELVVPWLKDPAQFREVSAKNPLLDILHVLTTDPSLPAKTQEISADQWQQVLLAVQERFVQETVAFAANHTDLLHELHLLQILPLRAGHAPAFALQLQWMEQLLRGLEVQARQAPELLDEASDDAIALWLKLRLQQPWTEANAAQVAALTSDNPLAQALQYRLQVRVAKTAFVRNQATQAQCAWLKAQGVAERHLAGDRFEWGSLRAPGCVYLDGNTQPTDTIEHLSTDPVTMAFDSVLFTGGWNLKLKAPAFDGSLVDLSTNLRAADLAIESPPDEDNAITFPLLMGVRMNGTNFLGAAGTYYFVYHYTWRPPQSGRKADLVAAPGYPGANFELDAPAAQVFAPKVISYGGPGQKAVPPRLGGAGDRSEVAWLPLATDLERARGARVGDSAQPIPLANPTLKLIDQLLTRGEVDSYNQIKLFIEPARLFKALDQKQRAKAMLACPNGETDLACWQALSLKAAQELWQRYAAYCPQTNGVRTCGPLSLSLVFDRLNSSQFDEAAAAVGPLNQDGAYGIDGNFSIKESR